MNNLVLLTKELIPVYQNQKGHKLVNARELHEFLEIGKDFTTWIKDRIDKYDFIENIDYIVFTENGGNLLGGRPRTEYILTMDTSKEISMVQNNTKGKEARKYFIAVERKFKEIIADTSQLSPETQLLLKLSQSIAKQEMANKQIAQTVQETKEEVQAIKDIIVLNPKAAWRRECNRILNAIGMKLNNYRLPKEEVYQALKERGNCRPNVLVNNLKKRARANGMVPSKVEKLNILDVLENEPRLKEVYVAIVKDMAIKNGVRI